MAPRLSITSVQALFLLAIAAIPARAGVPYVTDDPGTPAKGKFEVNVVSLLTRVQGDTGGAFTSLEVNYGITDHFQSHAFIPLQFDQAAGENVRIGAGDAEIGFKYRLLDGNDLGGWDIGIAPSLDVPPSGLSHGFGTGHTHGFLPLLAAKQWGSWTVFGEAGYAINPGYGNRNWEFTGVAVAYDINPHVTVGGEILYTSACIVGLNGGTGFDFAATYNLSDTYHLLFSIGRNITNATAVNEISSLLGIQFTF